MSRVTTGSVIEAIKAINPDVGVSVIDNDPDRITWDNPSDTISKADILAKIDAIAYIEKRKLAYPSIEECVHALLDEEHLSELQAKRKLVKETYPK
jgi:hypothetical protein